MPKFRLDRIIAGSGLYSRTEVTGLIRLGHVAVDGGKAMSGSEKYDPENVSITVDGEKLEYKAFRYIMMNKPRGYVTSTGDAREKTVMQLLDERYSKLGLFPAGRLDKDAEGFLLLTNDGDFAHKVITPSKKVAKRYFVKTDGSISDFDIEAFSRGLTLNDGTKCLSASLEPTSSGALITLYEGKYHQVKRMMSAIGKPVTYLKRIAIGGLYLDEDMAPGQHRELGDEINSVFDE